MIIFVVDMVKNEPPLISIAMATYNGDKYLSTQLNSILTQTYTNIEIIIVDDASTDKTIQIICEYQLKYNNRIKLIQNQSNLGVVRSFSKAIDTCVGEFIALSDQDDIWFTDKLSLLINNIGEALLIHSDAIVVKDNGELISCSHRRYSRLNSSKYFVDYLLGNNVTGCCAMFRRSFWEQIRPIPEDFYVHDHYLALMTSFYHGIKYYPKPLVYYRQHVSNTIGAKTKDYGVFIKQLHKIKHSMIALSGNIMLTEYDSDINKAIIYYDALILCKRVSITQLLWIYEHLPFRKFVGFIVCSMFGKTIAKFLYNKLR